MTTTNTTPNAHLTDAQIDALEEAGAEILRGWLRHADTAEGIDRDYEFSAAGDWELLRRRAQQAGVLWDGAQPDGDLEDRRHVWRCIERGYQRAYDKAFGD